MNSRKEVSDQDVCKDCGACCTHLFNGNVQLPPEGRDDVIEYYKRVGVTLFTYPDIGSEKYGLKVPCVCSCYNEKTGLCTEYETRPNVCRNFPSMWLPPIAPYCELMRNYKEEGKY
jgi:Fe-S-cluster containining protein